MTARSIALIAVVCAGLTAVHVAAILGGPEGTGVLLLLDHVFDVALALALLLLGTAVGLHLLRRGRVFPTQPLEALIFGTALGLGAIATAVLLLGLARGLYWAALLTLLLAFAALARREVADLPELLRRAASFIGETGGDRGFLLLGFLVFGAVAVFVVVFGVAPPVDWDALMYHLRVPAQYLAHHRIYLPEDNLHAAYVGLVHMLYLPQLAARSTSGPALLSGALALLLGLAVFSFARRFFDASTATLSLALVWGTTTLLLVAITPRVDVTVALYLFLAHYGLLVALESPEERGFVMLPAVLLGCAVGIKYNALAYVVALAPLAAWAVVKRTGGVSAAVRPAVTAGLVALAVMLPWFAKNWLLLGAPLYPFMTQRVMEPWLAALYAGAAPAASVDPALLRPLLNVRVPFNLRDAFLNPARLTVEAEGAFYYANRILLLLPLWVLFVRHRVVNWLLVPALAYLALVIVPFPVTNLRYLVPAAVPLTLAVTYVMVALGQRFIAERPRRLLLAFLAALALAPTLRTMYVWTMRTRALGYAAGAVSRDEFLATHHDPGVRVYAPMMQFVNANVPHDGKILMLFEARGFYLDPSAIQDNKVTNWPLLAAALEPGECLEAAGIDHVLVATGSLNYYVQRGLDLTSIKWGRFQEFAASCLEPIYDGPGYMLLEVKRGGAARPRAP